MNLPQIIGIISAIYILAMHCGGFRAWSRAGGTLLFQLYLVALGGVAWAIISTLYAIA